MPLRLAGLFLTLALAIAPAAFAGSKKENKASVTFHLQGEENDNPKMITMQVAPNGQKLPFSRIQTVGTKDILSYKPFPSDAGDYGIVVRLQPGAVNRVSALTAISQGKYLIAQVNGRFVDGVMIDKQIDDGMLVIWKGVSLADIHLLDQQFPRIGEEGQKKKKK